MEFGTVPLNFIHKRRRAIVSPATFVDKILKMEQPELVKQIYLAQISESKPGDFCELISTYLEDLKINMSEEQIASSGIIFFNLA